MSWHQTCCGTGSPSKSHSRGWLTQGVGQGLMEDMERHVVCFLKTQNCFLPDLVVVHIPEPRMELSAEKAFSVAAMVEGSARCPAPMMSWNALKVDANYGVASWMKT